MATLRAISDRLKSVKNIQKITKSMKMVSAAKYGRAEKELRAARPLEGAAEFLEKATLTEKSEIEKIDAEKKKNVLYVAVTSDKGLCGAVHSNVARHVSTSVADAKDDVRIVCIGDKSRGILQKKVGQHFWLVCSEVGRLPPTFLDACQIANEIIRSDYEFDLGKIVFNKFNSAVSYTVKEIPLFRISTVMKSHKIQNYEEADEETVTSFVEFSLAGLLFYAMKEGACSEQAARMTAMDNASRNAGEMIQSLTLVFNRTRQAVITRELIEIISGASAL